MSDKQKTKLISLVIPAFREAEAIEVFYKDLKRSLADSKYTFEIIFVDDGSPDDTGDIIRRLAVKDDRVRLLSLSRNFGKEIATTAGINNANGDAIITLDADGQHPAELIPEFIANWEAGYSVVVGVRSANQKEGAVKKYGSILFYKIFNKITNMELVPGSTDFRLIDRSVQQMFTTMTERNRITRGLIDWLGYERKLIYFTANPRLAGEPTYSVKNLVGLAVNSVISLSSSPLYIATYIGLIITPISVLLGFYVLIETLVGDPLGLNITGSAYVIVLMLMLVGVLLISQGVLGLYLSHIHSETQNRPLYVINHRWSVRAEPKNKPK